MTHNIQYALHLILHSKYKLVINIIVYSIIYLSINNVQITHCMTEDNTISTITESKSVSDTSAIITETDIRQILTDTIEKQREIIEQKEEEIKKITDLNYTIESDNYKACEMLTFENMCLLEQLADYKADLIEKKQELLEAVETITSLEETISKLTEEKKELQRSFDTYKKYLV